MGQGIGAYWQEIDIAVSLPLQPLTLQLEKQEWSNLVLVNCSNLTMIKFLYYYSLARVPDIATESASCLKC